MLGMRLRKKKMTSEIDTQMLNAPAQEMVNHYTFLDTSCVVDPELIGCYKTFTRAESSMLAYGTLKLDVFGTPDDEDPKTELSYVDREERDTIVLAKFTPSQMEMVQEGPLAGVESVTFLLVGRDPGGEQEISGRAKLMTSRGLYKSESQQVQTLIEELRTDEKEFRAAAVEYILKDDVVVDDASDEEAADSLNGSDDEEHPEWTQEEEEKPTPEPKRRRKTYGEMGEQFDTTKQNYSLELVELSKPMVSASRGQVRR